MPDPLALELAAIQQGISKADLLQQQAQAPRPIGSITQGIAQLAQAFFAGRAQDKAKGKFADFTTRNQAVADKQSQALSDALAAVQSGKPVPASARADASPALKRSLLASGLSANATTAAAKAKAGVTAVSEAKKAAVALKSANLKADLLESQGRLDPKNREVFVKANAAGQTGLVKPKESNLQSIGTAFADALGKAEKSKVAVKFLEQGKSVAKSLKSFDKTIDFIDKNPSSVTIGGTASEAISAINANLKGLGNTLGFDAGNIDIAIDSVGNDALKSASVRANIKKLVRDFARAKGEFGKSLSDKDLIDFTQQVSARWGNPDAIKLVLSERRNELVDEFNSDRQVYKEAGFNLPDIKSFDFKKRGIDKFTETLPAGVQLSDGTHTDASGNRIEVKNGKFRNL